MPNSLAPGFIQIDYHRSTFVHRMTIPTRVPLGIGDPITDVQYTTWGGGDVLASDMITDITNLMAALLTTESSFDSYSVFSQTDPELPVFLFAASISVPGLVTPVGDAQTAATQSTYMFRDTGNFKLKIVLMEAQLEVFTPKRGLASLGTDETLFANYILGDTHAWQSRAGLRPVVCKGATYTLNEKLRRSERLD